MYKTKLAHYILFYSIVWKSFSWNGNTKELVSQTRLDNAGCNL